MTPSPGRAVTAASAPAPAPTGAPAGDDRGARGRPGLLAALCLGAVLVSFIQSLVVPILGPIGAALGVSEAAASWVLTANLLSCAVLTPLLGRLGDLHGPRPILLLTVAVCLVGSVLAAATDAYALLIVARVLQGASGGVFPLAIGALRDELDGRALTRSTAIVSGTLSFGAGIGLVVAGVLTAGSADYRRVFWLCAVASLVVLAALALTVRRRERTATGRLDVVGAGLLGLGLLLALLVLTQVARWGVGSPATLGCIVGAVAVLWAWWRWEHRTPAPLVQPRMLRDPPVLATNLAGLAVGLANFGCFLTVSSYVQVDPSAGFGFGASPLRTATLFLLPAALVSAVVATLAGEVVHRLGGARPLAFAGGLGAAGFVGLALLHRTEAAVIGCTVLVLASVAIAYAAMPALLHEHVAGDQTAVANGVNSIARWVGGSVGSAAVAALVAGLTVDGVPRELAYVLAFGLGAVACAASAVLVLAVHRRAPHPG